MNKEPILAPLLVQNLRAYFKRLGLYGHVQMSTLRDELDKLNTATDLNNLVGTFYDYSPLFNYTVKTVSGKLARMFDVSVECALDQNTSYNDPVISTVQIKVTCLHPLFVQPFTMVYMAFTETDFYLQIFSVPKKDGSKAKGTSLFYNNADNNFPDPSLFNRLDPQGKFGKRLWHVKLALDTFVRAFPAQTDAAKTAKRMALEGYDYDGGYDKLLNPSLLDNLGRAIAMVDAGLKTDGAISKRYKDLRATHNDKVMGFDVVQLFDGYRDRVLVPELFARVESSKLIDIGKLSVLTTDEDFGALDTFNIVFSLGDAFALENMLFKLSTETGNFEAFTAEQIQENQQLEETIKPEGIKQVSTVVSDMLTTFVKQGSVGKIDRKKLLGLIRQLKSPAALVRQ